MIEVLVREDCGNAPKKLLLRDFNIAIANTDITFVDQNITSDIVWHLFEPSGQKQIHGKENVLEEYIQNLVIESKKVVIDTIITHGNTGAVSGSIKAMDEKDYVFCDIYKFSSHAKNAKIKEMTTFIIEKKNIEVKR